MDESSRPCTTRYPRERSARIREVMEHSDRHHEVERRVLEGQALSVRLHREDVFRQIRPRDVD
jgi:hypothetical protein